VTASRQPGQACASIDTGSQFARTSAADASGAARIRIEFAGWLQRHFTLGNEWLSDLVLAANEALANAAESGCLDTPGHGMIALTASYDAATDTLVVTVSDRGRLRPVVTGARESPAAPVQYALRGRGIPLMRVLADTMQIDTSERGTQVSLTWTHLSTPSNRSTSRP
jgi:serine/threonine-protein kinase RsbW